MVTIMLRVYMVDAIISVVYEMQSLVITEINDFSYLLLHPCHMLSFIKKASYFFHPFSLHFFPEKR
jgi:hypothetical protein